MYNESALVKRLKLRASAIRKLIASSEFPQPARWREGEPEWSEEDVTRWLARNPRAEPETSRRIALDPGCPRPRDG